MRYASCKVSIYVTPYKELDSTLYRTILELKQLYFHVNSALSGPLIIENSKESTF